MQWQKEKDNYPSEIGSQNAFLMAILHAALRDFTLPCVYIYDTWLCVVHFMESH